MKRAVLMIILLFAFALSGCGGAAENGQAVTLPYTITDIAPYRFALEQAQEPDQLRVSAYCSNKQVPANSEIRIRIVTASGRHEGAANRADDGQCSDQQAALRVNLNSADVTPGERVLVWMSVQSQQNATQQDRCFALGNNGRIQVLQNQNECVNG